MIKHFSQLILCVLFTTNFLYSGANRGTSAPLISGDTFRDNVDHIFDETVDEFSPEKVQEGDVIFLKTDWEYLETFFTDYHPKIKCRYTIVTHNSDHGAPGPFRSYLDDPKVIGWYAQNVEGESHPKLHPIPIGLANKCWPHGNPKIFKEMIKLSSNEERPTLCYMNFAIGTYPTERSYVWDLFSNEDWCIHSQPKSLTQYLQDLSTAKFVLSPRGNGLDCHRTWEALLMGAIPILKTSTLDPMFENLPVLVIEDWSEISEEYLHEQYEHIMSQKFSREKLYVYYWLQKIRAGK